MLASVMPDIAEARGVRGFRMEICFLLVVALATTMSVPVVGALLMFSLMIGAPGTARYFTDRPFRAMALSVAIALAIVWIAIAAAYESDWPVGFFVGVLGAVFFVLGGDGPPGAAPGRAGSTEAGDWRSWWPAPLPFTRKRPSVCGRGSCTLGP